jgi:formate hydrogenlyase subunit 3/multisubunit Na+/H+ antiporter MnhD subunit
MNAAALLAAVCWPALLAAGLVARWPRRPARGLAPWAALPALLVGLAGVQELELPWLMFGSGLGLDSVAEILWPATAALWLAAGLVAQHHLQPGPRRDAFFAWFLVAMSGNLLLLAALDAIVFYLGFALMSFTSYGLVIHSGDARARHAGRYYITLVVLGEICVISALMLLASRGPTDFASMRAILAISGAPHANLVMALLLAGFGIKAGLFGLHFWLPLAHPVAPAPASAVLSGAMIKAGLVAWLRLLPLGEAALPGWGMALAALGLWTAFYGVLAGLPQREAKTVLAYSSVSQMGLMALAVGLGLVWPQHWPALLAAVLLFAVHHGLSKGVLFIGAGLAQRPLGPASARLVAAVLCLAALAIAGAPLTGGLVAKLALKHCAALADPPWATWLPILLWLSSGMTALLMLRFLALAWPTATAGAPAAGPKLVAPWLLLLAASIAAPWLIADGVLRGEAVSLPAMLSASWPLAVAGLVTAGALALHRAGRAPALPVVPAGDLGIPLERGAIAIGRRLGELAEAGLPGALARFGLAAMAAARSGPTWAVRIGHGEERISAWCVTGLMVVLLATLFALLLA